MHLVTGFRSCGRFFGLRDSALLPMAAFAAVILGLATPGRAEVIPCNGELSPTGDRIGGTPADLRVEKLCIVGGGTYTFAHVNIIAGGKLIFKEPGKEEAGPDKRIYTGTDFWATSIIIENGGAMLAGVDDQKPYGTNGKTLTFHLYGKDRRANVKDSEGPGEPCHAPDPNDAGKSGDCGIPLTQKQPKDCDPKSTETQTVTVWAKDVKDDGKDLVCLPGGVKDYFYKYSNLHGNSGQDPTTKEAGHFGYKELALSYGGTLRLRGLKGTDRTSDAEIAMMLKTPESLSTSEASVVTTSGTDWVRLAGFDKAGALTLDRGVPDWQAGDEVVVTTTDFSPGHSELRVIGARSGPANEIKTTAPFDYDHNATGYNITAQIGTTETAFRTAIAAADGANPDNVPFLDGQPAETRAAVALLTRSIRIVSAGDTPGETFDQATARDSKYMYGGHVVFRQGLEKLQIQGVEFKQLGQGGMLGRYPVHFHIARRVPADTYIIDSSINESMTRWIVLHSTLGVTVARNVGYKSIGHGFFLEDATETDNKFYANIGIYARASVESSDNPRGIPGLLDTPSRTDPPLKYNSDSFYPSVFWITNGWNTFAGNMAAGAGTCGACYWFVPAGNHDMQDSSPMNNMRQRNPMKWSGYSAIQAVGRRDIPENDRAGLSPIRLFYKNYCSTAMHALSNTDGSTCESAWSSRIRNPRAPDAGSPDGKMYYPLYAGNRNPTICDPNLSDDKPGSCKLAKCSFANPEYCAPSVFSHFTSSFNYAQTNFSAIWLRLGYVLLDHAFVSDDLGPGVTLVTGGDYTRSNLPVGYWGLTSNSVFVGATRPDVAGALAKPPGCDISQSNCVDKASGAPYPITPWGTGQRLYNIYDGPAAEDANAFINIRPTKCNDKADCMYFETFGVRRAGAPMAAGNGGTIAKGEGYLPNAGIGWKQSNGFYYPPAFRSRNLFFKDVDIRHYVVEPLTYPGTYRTDVDKVKQQYVGTKDNNTVFGNYSDVDRQTELTDDDGSLTGFNQTISVNEDPFFRAPSQTAQCRSNVGVDASNACAGQSPPNPATARTSPYDYVTTALYPAEIGGGPDSNWGSDCTNPTCTGVPIYRQFLTGNSTSPPTREWKAWDDHQCDARRGALVGVARPVIPWDAYAYPKVSPPNPIPPLVKQFMEFDQDCPSPFVRMGGMNKTQRSVLTMNHGKYYIDTKSSAAFQRNTPELPPGSRIINVFEAGKTYHLFFLYATKSTKQTYQIYVGKDFDKTTMLKAERVDINDINPHSFKPWSVGNGAFPWKAELETRTDLEHVLGVLTVEVDYSKLPADAGNFDPKNLSTDDTCQPRTYCSKIGSGAAAKCGCDEKKLGALGIFSPNYKNVCKNVCQEWAVTDIDCPKTGCLGFRFTLPSSFKADDKFERPKPEAFPLTDAAFGKIGLQRTTTKPDKDDNKGGCYYPKIPNDTTDCKVAD